jgi:hypothetical protein
MNSNLSLIQKNDLLEDHSLAFELAMSSDEFAISPLSQDFDILSMVENDEKQNTIAHMLARHHSAWMFTNAAKRKDILRLTNSEKTTVALTLAMYQPQWQLLDEAKEKEILELVDQHGNSVAHYLAGSSREWINTVALMNKDILLIQNQKDWIEGNQIKQHKHWTVAHAILKRHMASDVYERENRNLDLIFSKEVMSAECGGVQLAEYLLTCALNKLSLNHHGVAYLMIKEGAVYKPTKILPLVSGEFILQFIQNHFDEPQEPLASIAAGQALYATIFHNIKKIRNSTEKQELNQWMELLSKSESIFIAQLEQHKAHIDINYPLVKYCEPAQEILNRFLAEHLFSGISHNNLHSNQSIENEHFIY